MKKVLTFCACLAVLLGVAGGADATLRTVLVDLGTLSVPSTTVTDRLADLAAVPVAPGVDSLADKYLFKVALPANLITLTTSFDTGFGSFLSPFEVQVWKVAVGAVGTPGACLADPDCLAFGKITPAGPDTFNDEITLTVAGLTPITQYTIFVQGFNAGEANASYNVKIDLTKVPLPPAVVLFLSALAGLAGFSRIQRRKAVAT